MRKGSFNMHVAIITVGAIGHVMPSLPVTAALVNRGVRVSYFTSDFFKNTIEMTGAKFCPVTTVLTKQGQADKGVEEDMVAQLPLRFLSEGANAIEQILDVLNSDKPDVIVADSVALAGRMAACKLNIPLIMIFTSYAPSAYFSTAQKLPKVPDTHPARAEAHRLADEMTSKYGVKHLDINEIFEGVGELNIVMLQRAFHPAGDMYDDRFVFAGAQIAKRVNSGTWSAPKGGLPIAYSSLGTIFNNWPEFFKMLSKAVSGMPVHMEAAIGTAITEESLGTLAENMHVSAFQPQLDILEKASLFITHAGTGSVMEAIYYGVPMLAIPQMDEQFLTATQLEKLGLGIMLNKQEVTSELLRASIEKLLTDKSYAERLRVFKADMRASGGCELAAEAIIDFVNKRA